MRAAWAIARLTFWEGVRMRVVLIFVVVLVLIVLRLPFALRGDETLSGRLQTFLAYSLTATGVLLGVAVVFLSCATLSNELRTRTLHLVVTKPVSRFQIVLGKWLGINALALLLLAVCGLTIYGFGTFIAGRPEQFARDRLQVRDVVWTARLAAEPKIPDFSAEAAAQVAEMEQQGVALSRGPTFAAEERARELQDRWRMVAPGQYRVYEFENLPEPEREDTVYQIRYEARGSPIPPEELLPIGWLFVDPETGAPLMPEPKFTRERVSDVHQFLVYARPIVRNGKAALMVINPTIGPDASTIQFEGEHALKLFYKVGNFESNLLKVLGLTALTLAFLSGVGVFFSTFVSFPIACLCTFTVFLVGASTPVWKEAIGANMQVRTDKIDPYGALGPVVRPVLMGIMQTAFPDLARYNGVSDLVDGVVIRSGLVLEALTSVGIRLLIVITLGWYVFWQREVAGVSS